MKLLGLSPAYREKISMKARILAIATIVLGLPTTLFAAVIPEALPAEVPLRNERWWLRRGRAGSQPSVRW